MKDLRAAIRALLLADGGISALVGGTRIYTGVLPQGQTQLSIVQNLVTEASDIAMDGPTGLGTARVQIDCWSQQQDPAVALANLVKDTLMGHRGSVAFGSDSPQEEIEINGVFMDQGRDDFDALAKMHRRSRDYTVWYREA